MIALIAFESQECLLHQIVRLIDGHATPDDRESRFSPDMFEPARHHAAPIDVYRQLRRSAA
jgi:hypothetical protein